MINSQENNIHIESIGGRVKSLRDSAGLNQTDFAEKLGVKQAFISKVEKNNASLTIDHIILLKNIFDVDMNWLLTGEGEKEQPTSMVAEESSKYGKGPIVKRIDTMLMDMDEEAQRDVLKYTEEKKLLAELIAAKKQKDAA